MTGNSPEDLLHTIPESVGAHMSALLQQTWFFDRFIHKAEWYGLFQDSLKVSDRLIRRQSSLDLFIAYKVIGARWFSHLESVDLLLVSGRYGDSLAICRMIVEDLDLLMYLGLHPEMATTWRSKMGREPNWKDKEYRSGVEEFRPSRVRGQLKDAGVETPSQTYYTVLSSAVHTTEWGSQFYGTRIVGPTGPGWTVELQPRFDRLKAAWTNRIILHALPFAIYSFVTMCRNSKVPRNSWNLVEKRYKNLVGKWEVLFQATTAHYELMQEFESRLMDGENPEELADELEARIESNDVFR